MHIQKLILYTSGLSNQVQFYSNLLELDIVDQQAGKVTFKAGNTMLVFKEKAKTTPYHFAFNIPNNQIHEVHDWLKQKVNILKDQDAGIIDFTSWNAKAVYFRDADNNILELIARSNLENALSEPFSAQHLLEISEIGMPVDNVSLTYKALHHSTGLGLYSGDNERFSAIGDEQGLFVCIDKHNKTWIPTGEEAYASPFEIWFSHNKQNWFLEFKNGKTHLGRIK